LIIYIDFYQTPGEEVYFVCPQTIIPQQTSKKKHELGETVSRYLDVRGNPYLGSKIGNLQEKPGFLPRLAVLKGI